MTPVPTTSTRRIALVKDMRSVLPQRVSTPLGETTHQSCLLVTSREAPAELAVVGGGAVRTLQSLAAYGIAGRAAQPQLGASSECYECWPLNGSRSPWPSYWRCSRARRRLCRRQLHIILHRGVRCESGAPIWFANRPPTSQDMVANQEGNTRACTRRIQAVQAKYRGISILDRNVPALCVQSGL